MIRTAAILLVLASIGSCYVRSATTADGTEPNGPQQTYAWTKVLESAPWSKSYNYQMFAVGDRLWVFHPDGNWSSSDGRTWTNSRLSNAIKNLAFLDYIYFKGAMYGLGHFEGNIEKFTFQPNIYRTTDFLNWKTISQRSNIPRRYFYHPFVFAGKIWIIGGEDKTTKFADIWTSSDGVRWVKLKDNLPFGPRSNSQVVVLGGKLYLLNNDVWVSSNALDWEQVTPEIVKGEQIFGYNALVFDDKIWLLGCNRNGQFSSQVLVSGDGKNWEGQRASWSPRGGIAAAVFDEKIYMTGGKYGGTPDQPDFIYSNDLWTLSVTTSK